MKKVNCLIIFACLSSAVIAQVSQVWVSRYDSTVSSQGNQVIVDRFGNVYATGYIGNGYGTIRYNPATGDTLWVRKYAGGSARSIAADRFGNIYVMGTVSGSSLTIKYNSAGVQLWTASSGGFTTPVEIKIDTNCNAYITGYGPTFGMRTIKYDSSGTQIWTASHRVNGNDSANSICLDRFGNVFVTGYVTINSSRYACTIKYNPVTGDSVWVRLFHSYVHDRGIGVGTDYAGYVYVAGISSSSFPNSGDDYLTLKYSPAGVLLWYQIYGIGYFEYATPTRIAVDSSGNAYVFGGKTVSGFGPPYYFAP